MIVKSKCLFGPIRVQSQVYLVSLAESSVGAPSTNWMKIRVYLVNDSAVNISI